MASAMPPSPDHVPIARARSSSQNDAEMIARLPGTSSDALIPWMQRAAIKVAVDGATPHNSDAAAKPSSPIMNMRRRPNRSPSEPPITSNEPSVSK